MLSDHVQISRSYGGQLATHMYASLWAMQACETPFGSPPCRAESEPDLGPVIHIQFLLCLCQRISAGSALGFTDHCSPDAKTSHLTMTAT